MLSGRRNFILPVFLLIFLSGGAWLADFKLHWLIVATAIPAGFAVGTLLTEMVWKGWRLGLLFPLMLICLLLEYNFNTSANSCSWFNRELALLLLSAGWGGVFAAGQHSEHKLQWRTLITVALLIVITLLIPKPPRELADGILFRIYVWFCIISSMLVPDIWLRLVAVILTHTLYKAHLSHTERIPENGGALLLANHVSMLDALILICSTSRRIQFMVHERFFAALPLHLLFRWLGVWRVPGANKTKEMRSLFANIHNALECGELVALFPEGQISPNGITQLFHGSPVALTDGLNVPMLPVRLGLLRGSALILHDDKLHINTGVMRPLIASVTVGEPLKPGLSGFEVRQILHQMGAEEEAKRQYKEMPIHFQILRNAKQHPLESYYIDAMADNGINNFQLALRSMIFSKKIRELVKSDSPYVGVMLPNCVNMTMTMFAVMMADRIPAVVNFTSGAAARKAALTKAGVTHVLTSRKFLAKLKLEPEDGMIMLEDIVPKVTKKDKILALAALTLLPRRLTARLYFPQSWNDVFRTALVLFSSGSSGTPKGVMLSHRNINSDFYSFYRVVGWTKNDRLLGNLPLFHAYGMNVGFWVPAMARLKVIYMTNPLDAALTGQVVEHHKVTMIMATPTFLQTYMRRCTAEQFKSLRLVITGGEKLRKDIAEKFHDMTGLSIVEGYGCTELSPIVSINLAQCTFDLGRESGKPGSIGVPMPGVFVKIVDMDTGAMLPPNQSGLLLVKGGLVMQGYLNDPEATRNVLSADGFYDTGDIAQMDESGYITITGRRSRFSKISGEMVPDELVEMHLNELLESDSRVLAVTGAPDAKKGEKLVVFYSITDLQIPELLDKLRQLELPNLWIPRPEDFHYIEHIPLLGSGKLDLQALKKLAAEL